jgi:vitamin B12 transporter
VLGADYDDKKLTSNIIAGGEQGIKKWAVFLNDTLVFNTLAITPGIRYEKTDTSGDATSPSLGMTYSLANSTILRLYAAKASTSRAWLQIWRRHGILCVNPGEGGDSLVVSGRS